MFIRTRIPTSNFIFLKIKDILVHSKLKLRYFLLISTKSEYSCSLLNLDFDIAIIISYSNLKRVIHVDLYN